MDKEMSRKLTEESEMTVVYSRAGWKEEKKERKSRSCSRVRVVTPIQSSM